MGSFDMDKNIWIELQGMIPEKSFGMSANKRPTIWMNDPNILCMACRTSVVCFDLRNSDKGWIEMKGMEKWIRLKQRLLPPDISHLLFLKQ